jgi:hypothetical protein
MRFIFPGRGRRSVVRRTGLTVSGLTDGEPSQGPPGTYHGFRDGDEVILVIRLDNGELAEETVDYEGIVQAHGETYVSYHLYRPDSCTDTVPLRQIEEIRLVRTLEERVAAKDPTLED